MSHPAKASELCLKKDNSAIDTQTSLICKYLKHILVFIYSPQLLEKCSNLVQIRTFSNLAWNEYLILQHLFRIEFLNTSNQKEKLSWFVIFQLQICKIKGNSDYHKLSLLD